MRSISPRGENTTASNSARVHTVMLRDCASGSQQYARPTRATIEPMASPTSVRPHVSHVALANRKGTSRILIHGSVPNADFIQGRIQHHARAATGWQPSDEESVARCCFARSTSPEDRSWVCHNICRIPQWLQLTIDIDRNVRTAFDCHEDVRPVTNGNGSIRGKNAAGRRLPKNLSRTRTSGVGSIRPLPGMM